MSRAQGLSGPLVLAVAVLTSLFAFPVAAHSLGSDPSTSSGQPAVASDIVSGTVDELVVDDRVRNSITSYPLLVQDDGTTVPLVGTQAATLPKGARVGILGRWEGRQFEVAQAETLAAPALSPPATTTSDVEGTLAIIHADDFLNGRSRFMYHVRGDAGGVTSLQAVVLPSGLRGGMRVIASGSPGTDPGSLRPQRITILADSSGPGGGQSPVVQQSPTTNTVLVIMANFSDTSPPGGFTQASAQSVMTTSAGSVANFYNEMSYGQQLLNVTVTPTWVTMTTTSTSNDAKTCNYTNIGNAANAASTAAGYNPANYGFVVYLIPALSSCGWSGLAYVGYPHLSWINGVGSFITLVVAHEMGHNFGLLHAGSLDCGSVSIGGSCSVAEYGDPWDTMGNQRPMHFNATQKSILNWISSSAVKTHGSGTASYTLSPLEQGGGSVYAVKIPTSNSNRTYWLEFRQPIGFDAGMSSYPPYSTGGTGAQVRVSSPFEWVSGADDTEIVDMTPATSGTFTDSALAVGQTYSDGSTGVTVTVVSASANALTLSVTTSAGTATTTSLTSSINPSSFGANVTFTASVTGTSPTGSVNFQDGANSISGCSAVALAGSGNTLTAACSTASLTAATHSISAVYSGNATNSSSTSNAVSQVVNKAVSTTSIATSSTPSSVGATVTFTASVSAAAPTGTVNFKDGANSISSCSAVALAGSGNLRTAQCATSGLAAGTHSITAVYSGDSSNNGSTSGTLSQVVNGMAATTTSVGTSANPSTVGSTVTFTATVTGASPTGTANFKDGATSISGCSAVSIAGSGNTRTAQCATSGLGVGTHSITAAYGGDATNNASQSSTLSEVISGGASGVATNVALAANGGVAIASSTFSSSYPVSAVNNGDRAGLNFGAGGVWKDATNGVFPDWVEIDFNGSKTIDQVVVYSAQDQTQAPLDPSDTLTFSKRGLTAFNVQTWNGSAWVTQGSVTGNNLVKRSVSFAAVATSKIRVVINGAAGNARTGIYSYVAEIEAWTPGSAPPAAPVTTVSTSVNPAQLSQSVTFTESVTGSSPTGTVAFASGGNPIAGCGAIPLAGSGNTRTAACTTSFGAAGKYTISGTYGGDANNSASSAAVSQSVGGRR